MERRERLIRAMNPPGKRAHSAATQELTLALHDLSVAMPAGWSMGYEIADDTPYEDGGSNLDVFDAEHKPAWRAEFQRRHAAGHPHAKDDHDAIPNGGHHIHIIVEHEDGREAHAWIDRNVTPGQLKRHVDDALAEARKRSKTR